MFVGKKKFKVVCEPKNVHPRMYSFGFIWQMLKVHLKSHYWGWIKGDTWKKYWNKGIKKGWNTMKGQILWQITFKQLWGKI
jgi:hypothetical protein